MDRAQSFKLYETNPGCSINAFKNDVIQGGGTINIFCDACYLDINKSVISALLWLGMGENNESNMCDVIYEWSL